jgi:hypothetical protein
MLSTTIHTKEGAMNEYWIIAVVLAAFSLGYWVGYKKGRSDEQRETILDKTKLEATRIWVETMKPFMEAKNGKHK